MSGDSTTRGPRYTARVVWTGNTGPGTSGYESYGRTYSVHIAGKPELAGSADPAFRGDADRHNPEELFLTALAACHMLFYLSLCARRGVRVLAYEDEATASLTIGADGGGRISEVRLNPVVTIADDADAELAERLHGTAHALCFLANSCRAPIWRRATVRTANASAESEGRSPS